jgi:polygalacturonase
LLQIEGTGIKISGASGALLNANGARWWDGEGGSGGKTKPKFFYAHDLTDSTITNLHIQNTPVQAVSIAGCDGLTVTDMTIDNSAGDSEGKNTDGFDIGTSSNVVINGANVYNQDDCVAINSGTVSSLPLTYFGLITYWNISNEPSRASRSRTASVLVDMVYPSGPLVAVATTLSRL